LNKAISFEIVVWIGMCVAYPRVRDCFDSVLTLISKVMPCLMGPDTVFPTRMAALCFRTVGIEIDGDRPMVWTRLRNASRKTRRQLSK